MTTQLVNQDRVLTLLKAGVRANTLMGRYLVRKGWSIKFSYFRDKEIAKSAAREFLEQEYRATNIRFYRTADMPEGEFWAEFDRGDITLE